ILLATFQRTAEALRAAPTPTTEPVTVCVVETGMPRKVAANSMIAPAAEAQQPWTGVIRVILEPTVRTIRQPPPACPVRSWPGKRAPPRTARRNRCRDDPARIATRQ